MRYQLSGRLDYNFVMQAAVISDILVLYVVKRRIHYRENKYLNVIDPSTGGYEVVDEKDAAEV